MSDSNPSLVDTRDVEDVDDDDTGHERVAVLMGDPSAEAEGVAQALRAAGFDVVDAPLSMLVPRVAVQLPRVVVFDAEASEAPGLVREIRALPGGQMIQIVLLGGQPGGVEANADHPLAEEAIAFFARPVDDAEVVRKVELLTGGPGNGPRQPAPRPSAPPSIAFGRRNLTPPPPSLNRPGSPHPAAQSASLSPVPSQSQSQSPSPSPAPMLSGPLPAYPRLPSIRPSQLPSSSRSGAAIEAASGTNAGTPAGTFAGSVPGTNAGTSVGPPARISQAPRDRRSSIPSLAAPPTGFSPRFSRQAPLSREIEQLLAEAEERASGTRGSDSMFPSPEEELAAVLPADLLASLDQPLEEEEDDDEPERELPRGNTEQGRRSVTSSGRRRADHDSDSPAAYPTNAPSRAHETGAGAEPQATSFVHLDNPASRSPRSSAAPPPNSPLPGSQAAAGSGNVTHAGSSAALGSMPSMRSEQVHTMPPSAPPGTGRESQRAPSGAPSFVAAAHSYAPMTREASGLGLAPFDSSNRALFAASPASFGVPPTPMHGIPAHTGHPAYAAPLHSPFLSQTGQSAALGQSAFGSNVQSGGGYPSASGASPGAAISASSASAGGGGGGAAMPVVPLVPVVPSVLGPGDAARALAHVIAARVSGSLSLENVDGVRRVVLREGDVITAASGVDSETLLGFLAARGELPRDQVERLAGKIPPFGRHAGAALVAHGHLRQDQLWPVLRAHAEWILGRALLVSSGTASLDSEAPGRLRGEPSVFGGATGGEVFVEAVRRVISPDLAVQRLGGIGARLGFGPASQMLAECNLEPTLRERLERGAGETVGALIGAAPEADVASVLYALATLGVFETMRAVSNAASRQSVAADASSASSGQMQGGGDLLDVDAVRARVRARVQLVEEGDYFELLGIARDATGYEIRRAFLELRRVFEPSRILTPELADLKGDVDAIASVLDEAYEILRDNARRERYRRAISD